MIYLTRDWMISCEIPRYTYLDKYLGIIFFKMSKTTVTVPFDYTNYDG